MYTQTIELTQAYPFLRAYGSHAKLRVYARKSWEFHKGTSWPALLVCPGGGYQGLSEREGEPVALEFLARGYQCFVLEYSCAPTRFPAQLLEAAAALRYVRSHAAAFDVQAQRVGVMGFSAGGHLAGMLATLWDAPELQKELGHTQDLRPDALCLAYAVISTHLPDMAQCFVHLLGQEASAAQMQRLSLETAVRPDMPPAFVWHTAADQLVPVQNSLLFANAMAAAGVPFELHVFPKGGHGLSLATSLTADRVDAAYGAVSPYAARWAQWCAKWLAQTL